MISDGRALVCAIHALCTGEAPPSLERQVCRTPYAFRLGATGAGTEITGRMLKGDCRVVERIIAIDFDTLFHTACHDLCGDLGDKLDGDDKLPKEYPKSANHD